MSEKVQIEQCIRELVEQLGDTLPPGEQRIIVGRSILPQKPKNP